MDLFYNNLYTTSIYNLCTTCDCIESITYSIQSHTQFLNGYSHEKKSELVARKYTLFHQTGSTYASNAHGSPKDLIPPPDTGWSSLKAVNNPSSTIRGDTLAYVFECRDRGNRNNPLGPEDGLQLRIYHIFS